jgi:uncharacterized protein (TIGR02453 family)
VTLAWQAAAPDRGTALRREWAIKQLSRKEKEAVVRQAAGGDAPRFAGFSPAAFRFLSGLKRRNTRPWFEARRPIYESELRAPMLALIEEVDARLGRIAPEIVGDPRRSMFRIHRDTRFSRDKSPYKTHAACWFYHRDAGRGVGGEAEGGAGFYFHLAPDGCFAGGGIWMPPRASLGRIRDAVAEDPRGFERIVLAPGFRRRFGPLDDEAMLVRMPRGFADTHPAARWLRYQSFTAGRALTREQVCSPRLPGLLARDFEALTPLIRWLNAALGFGAIASRV